MADSTTTVRFRIPSLCHHKSSGQAVVRLNGKDVYCGTFGTAESKAKYERVITEWLQRGRQLPPWLVGDVLKQDAGAFARPVTNRLSVAELILAYKFHTDDYFRDSPSEREKFRLAVRPLREIYSLTPVAEFGPLALKAVRQKMLEVQCRTITVRDKNRKQIGEKSIEYRLSRSTINMRIDIIKRMFAWGVENELVPAPIWHALQSIRGLRKGRSSAPEPKRILPVPDTDVEAVLPLVSSPVRAMIEIQRLTGARSGEICIMRGCDLDKSSKIWIYRPCKHKNDHRENGLVREIPIGPKGQAILTPFLDRDPSAFLFSPQESVAERYRLLRLNRKSKVPLSQMNRKKPRPRKKPGARYSVKSYQRAVLKACKKAKIKRWHPHQLRHSAATHLRRQYGIETARIILGHSTAFTTEVYAERDRQRAVDVMAEVG